MSEQTLTERVRQNELGALESGVQEAEFGEAPSSAGERFLQGYGGGFLMSLLLPYIVPTFLRQLPEAQRQAQQQIPDPAYEWGMHAGTVQALGWHGLCSIAYYHALATGTYGTLAIPVIANVLSAAWELRRKWRRRER